MRGLRNCLDFTAYIHAAGAIAQHCRVRRAHSRRRLPAPILIAIGWPLSGRLHFLKFHDPHASPDSPDATGIALPTRRWSGWALGQAD